MVEGVPIVDSKINSKGDIQFSFCDDPPRAFLKAVIMAKWDIAVDID